jgi:hypothetical protein
LVFRVAKEEKRLRPAFCKSGLRARISDLTKSVKSVE